jgi:hypothetical protein
MPNTADGRPVTGVHHEMHDEKSRGLTDFLKRYSNAEPAVLSKVLGDVMAAKKVGIRNAPAG